MIALPIQWRAVAMAAVLASAFVAGWTTNGWRWESKLLHQQQQEQEHQNALLQSEQTIIAAYRSRIDFLHSRPARRLLICPDLPAAPVAGSGGSAPGVADPGPGEDIGPAVRACLGELYRYRELSRALQLRSP